jgi:thiamine-monophosphate kinase
MSDDGPTGPAAATTVAAVGEDGLVAGVLARYGAPPAEVLVGPGDDAAVLDVPGRTVISTDTLVEGYDFRRDWSSAHDVGVKTAAQNLADVAAMGATPCALVVSLATPGDVPVAWVRELADGLAAECARAGAGVVGGDVSQAGEIVITGTALGLLPGPAVLRRGARPGDVIALSGVTGPSAAGLALLFAGVDVSANPQLSALVRAHLAPQPGYVAGPIAAAAGATAMIDTSDGLLRDARRVAEASGVVLDLDPAALRPGEDLLAAARVSLGGPGSAAGDGGGGTAGDVAGDVAGDEEVRTATGWVLSGGEDHALLACFPAAVAVPEPFRVIGVVRAAADDAQRPGVLVGGRLFDGTEGWLHFA